MSEVRKLRENYDYIKIDPDKNAGMKFMVVKEVVYWSPRYKKFIRAESGFKSDGATGAKDLEGSMSWLMHDKLCQDATWYNGTPLSNWQASMVLRDILSAEGYLVRKRTWFWMTLMFGGRKVRRRNGWVWSWKR